VQDFKWLWSKKCICNIDTVTCTGYLSYIWVLLSWLFRPNCISVWIRMIVFMFCTATDWMECAQLYCVINSEAVEEFWSDVLHLWEFLGWEPSFWWPETADLWWIEQIECDDDAADWMSCGDRGRVKSRWISEWIWKSYQSFSKRMMHKFGAHW